MILACLADQAGLAARPGIPGYPQGQDAGNFGTDLAAPAARARLLWRRARADGGCAERAGRVYGRRAGAVRQAGCGGGLMRFTGSKDTNAGSHNRAL